MKPVGCKVYLLVASSRLPNPEPFFGSLAMLCPLTLCSASSLSLFVLLGLVESVTRGLLARRSVLYIVMRSVVLLLHLVRLLINVLDGSSRSSLRVTCGSLFVYDMR